MAATSGRRKPGVSVIAPSHPTGQSVESSALVEDSCSLVEFEDRQLDRTYTLPARPTFHSLEQNSSNAPAAKVGQDGHVVHIHEAPGQVYGIVRAEFHNLRPQESGQGVHYLGDEQYGSRVLDRVDDVPRRNRIVRRTEEMWECLAVKDVQDVVQRLQPWLVRTVSPRVRPSPSRLHDVMRRGVAFSPARLCGRKHLVGPRALLSRVLSGICLPEVGRLANELDLIAAVYQFPINLFPNGCGEPLDG